MTKPDYTRSPYNYDPDDQPAPPSKEGGTRRSTSRSPPPRHPDGFVGRLSWNEQIPSVGNRIAELNYLAQAKAMQRGHGIDRSCG